MALDLSVLIVEDHQYMRRILRPLVRTFLGGGSGILEARDAETALDMMESQEVDLMLVDLRLPGMSGLDLIRRIRTTAVTGRPSVPILVISGQATQEMAAAARDAGANGFLAKPISADQFYKRLRNLIADDRPFIRTPTYFGPDRRRPPKPDALPYMGPYRRALDEDSAWSRLPKEIAKALAAGDLRKVQEWVSSKSAPMLDD